MVKVSRVLVCDGERHILRLIQVNLLRQGYEVATASNGREALEVFGERRPDLMILDASLPELDGFEVLKAIRSDPKNDDVCVIMTIESGSEEAFARAFREGANRCQTKPKRGNDDFRYFK